MKKLALLFSLIAGSAFGCWYQKGEYTDYIYSINDIPVIGIETNFNNFGLAKYTVTNNIVVDFPITVKMKLMSDEVIDIGDGITSSIGNITGKLQYRLFPNGDWVTVQDYTVPSGKISKDSKPTAYFGQNNISPSGCKAGDVLLIRLYVTDGMWQSGNLSGKCNSRCSWLSTPFGDKMTFPNTFEYAITQEFGGGLENLNLYHVDLGDGWYPHFAVTVIYSGKTRPIR